ncbi:hypothetical protein BD309DRAFT_1049907 [Dichomitus squalens]|nr:hypothetical protein BD309DRAFT_1049907 [Dichomitus squalens]
MQSGSARAICVRIANMDSSRAALSIGEEVSTFACVSTNVNHSLSPESQPPKELGDRGERVPGPQPTFQKSSCRRLVWNVESKPNGTPPSVSLRSPGHRNAKEKISRTRSSAIAIRSAFNGRPDAPDVCYCSYDALNEAGNKRSLPGAWNRGDTGYWDAIPEDPSNLINCTLVIVTSAPTTSDLDAMPTRGNGGKLAHAGERSKEQ